MNSRERVLSAYKRTGYDRIPIKHEGTPEVNHMIMQYFGITNMNQLLKVVGDDFRYVEAIYTGPKLETFPDGSFEGYWGERYKYVEFGTGKYMESCYQPFAGVDTLAKLDRSHFPEASWFDYSTIRTQCENFKGEYALCFGGAGDMDFINSIARAKGMEEVMIDMMLENEAFIAIMDQRFKFYYEMHENVLKAAGGLIDFTHIGEDLGNQRGPMIGMDLFETYFAPKFKQYFDMVHSYGAKVMMHMCGAVDAFLPRLIELGLDIQDVVQPTTPEMDIAYLKQHFGDKLIFQGSMDVQHELAFGTPEDVCRETRRRLDLFPLGGMFFGPSHAIQSGSPLENILAMYREAGGLTEIIDDSILSIKGDEENVDAVNLAKLF